MADTRTDASITIGADLTPMQAAFTQAQTLVKNSFDSMASTAKTSLAGIAASFAAAFAFKELKDFFDNVAETRAHLAELAETTGTTVETLSQIQGVAKVSGASMDDVSGALVRLTKGLATGEGETGKAANALTYLGISARNSDGSLRDAGDLYLEIATKLAGYGDGAGKTALALDLFGKAGAAQLPLLKDLAATGDLVTKTTTEQAETAKDYEQNLNRLSIQLSENKKVIAGEMIPAANDFVKALLDLISDTNGLTNELKDLKRDGSLEEWARTAAVVLASVADAAIKVGQGFKFVGEGLGASAAQQMAILRGDFAQADAISKDFDDRMKTMFDGPTLEDRLKKQFALSDQAKTIDFGKRSGAWDSSNYTGTGKPAKGEDTSKAEYAVAKAQFEAALALQKEYLKDAQEGYDDAYKHNLISIEEYYADRIATEQAGIQLEIDAKNKEIQAVQAAEATATTDKERLNLKAQEIKLTGELTVLTAQ